ncbi:guanylate kinase [Candidatus Aerophobetes bacterium]|nr:guanylate kinase [Candidatus Aerophobetes bacterium]
MLKRKKEGLIIVISAPSGVGKTTLCKRLLQALPFLTHSVSFTTRQPRKNEIEGIDYYFVSVEEFQKMIERKEFVEWTKVHGEFYGTSSVFLNKIIEGGKDAILEVDVKGGINIKEKYPQATLIFLLPPSWEELEKRLRARGTETNEKIKRRIKRAKKEIEYAVHYDYLVINDKINDALEDLFAIIRAERCRTTRTLSIENLKRFIS